ncbi:hypothetical protein [Nocardioides speluncae]|uniref:hypothetical protein n=1 Tax=Nocardioides speluncae TaxID=2670337 RepID=UPI000D6858E9|nr:hypothetical protein [Nocardioides speluncae]
MSDQTTVVYRGPAPFASALAQMLREEGVEVNYAPPIEERGGGIVEAVVVSLACSATYDLIKAGVLRFRASRFGASATVELPNEDTRGDAE